MANTNKTILDAVAASHEATNELMRVQFKNVEQNFAAIHSAMADMKRDWKRETDEVKAEVSDNRKVAEERHIGIVKKIYYVGGALAAIEILAQIFHHVKP